MIARCTFSIREHSKSGKLLPKVHNPAILSTDAVTRSQKCLWDVSKTGSKQNMPNTKNRPLSRAKVKPSSTEWNKIKSKE